MLNSSIACIAYQNNQVFIAKRKQIGDMGGKREFPGGKVEEGESFETAIRREMQEEFFTDVEVLDKITESEFIHKNQKCSLNVYLIKFLAEINVKKEDLPEHTDYQWVELKTIETLNFVDSDKNIYPSVCEFIKNKKIK